MVRVFLFFIFFSLTACVHEHIQIVKQKIDRSYLASSHVNSPDPRQDNPPLGQKLFIKWKVDRDILGEEPQLFLKIIFHNHEEMTMVFPVDDVTGNVYYSLLNDDYIRTGGILTYRADIKLDNGSTYSSWEHQLWVNLIHVDAESNADFSEYQ